MGGKSALCSYFYPRPPRGGRPLLPVQRENRHTISIHALREEGDALNQDSEKRS